MKAEPEAPHREASHDGGAPCQSRGGIGAGAARVAAIDALRGVALAGMLAYHSAWDLHAFGVSAVDPGASPAWRILGHGVAGLFLLLSGIGLSLARRRGGTARQAAWRLVRLGGAAAAVTAVTVWVSPQAPVWFGILHCIAATNLGALLVIDAPAGVLVGLAALAMLLPLAVSVRLGPVWAWTGLTTAIPPSLDYRPVLPWLGVVLLGVALGQRIPASRTGDRAARPRTTASAIVDALRWSGRRSLPLYLVHQPILIGALMVVTGAGWPEPHRDDLNAPAQAKAFLQACARDCVGAGGEPALCRSTCHCVLTRAVGTDAGATPLEDKVAAAVATCRPPMAETAPRVR